MTTNAVVLAVTGSLCFNALTQFHSEPLVLHAIRRIEKSQYVDSIVVIASTEQFDQIRTTLADADLACPIQVIEGDEGSLDSLRKASKHFKCEDADDVVLIHDSTRAFTPSALIQAVVKKIRDGFSSVVPVLPITDTIKHVDEHGILTGAVDRELLREVQSPQGFSSTAFHTLLEKAPIQKIGYPFEPVTQMIPGHPLGLRISTSVELAAAESMIINQEPGSSS